MIAGRVADRLLHAPRTRPEEAGLGPALDALGGEVVRLRSRDGLRLTGRWLDPLSAGVPADAPGTPWSAAPDEAILLLHGWTGSIAPDLVEFGPTLRGTADVLGLDFRGHGGSDEALTTFGLHEVEDVAGALTWLADRGVRRVALVGSSMGGMTAIAATVMLGDGRLRSVDADPDAPSVGGPPAHPKIVAIVAESVSPELPTAVAGRLPVPRLLRGLVARRAFAIAARRLGQDPRATEPARVIGLLEDLPLLLVHGLDDRTVPAAAGRRLADRAGAGAELWLVPGADHGGARQAAPEEWDARIGGFLRAALSRTRGEETDTRRPEGGRYTQPTPPPQEAGESTRP